MFGLWCVTNKFSCCFISYLWLCYKYCAHCILFVQVLQLYQICNLNHGLMMVGPSGSGKSTAWRVLLRALEHFEGVEGVAHVIDPKAISKEALYGVLDPNTREWTDGLFTHILRSVE